jgi:hypothetical protein
MPRPPERRWPGIATGYVAFVGLLVLATTPFYLFATPAYKPLVLRLAASAVAGVALIHLGKVLREGFEAQGDSAFERALEAVTSEAELAPTFVDLRDEIRFGTASRGYFDRVLWPRIVAVAQRGADAGPAALHQPAGRLCRRGPSCAGLSNAIADIEDRT